MGRFINGDGNASIPFYVTRKTAGSEKTGQLSMSIWMQLLVVLLVWFNLVLWGLFGLYEFGHLVLTQVI